MSPEINSEYGGYLKGIAELKLNFLNTQKHQNGSGYLNLNFQKIIIFIH